MAVPLRDLAREIADGRTTAREVAESCLAQLKAVEQDVQAWVPFDHSLALARADNCIAGGPLSGIPFGVKDIYDTAELPTEWGAEVYKGQQPAADAALIAELKALGAYVFGKTHTTAFAYYDPAPTRNPHNLAHTPGGSSSGSAAAVAAGMVSLALGSQTQGSVLRPASFCGVVGFKPGRRVLPAGGMLPCSPALDTAGLFTRTVDDMRFVWEALRPGGDSREAKRFFVLDWPPHKQVEPRMAERVHDALKKLQSAGLDVQKVAGPASFQALPQAIADVMSYEAARTHHDRYEEYGQRLGMKLAGLVEAGRAVSDAAYALGLEAMQLAERDFAEWAGEDTVVITPASVGPAPNGLESTGDPACNAPWTAVGASAISVPCGTVDGLPVGLQLTAPAGLDAMLLRTAATVDRALQA